MTDRAKTFHPGYSRGRIILSGALLALGLLLSGAGSASSIEQKETTVTAKEIRHRELVEAARTILFARGNWDQARAQLEEARRLHRSREADFYFAWLLCRDPQKRDTGHALLNKLLRNDQWPADKYEAVKAEYEKCGAASAPDAPGTEMVVVEKVSWVAVQKGGKWSQPIHLESRELLPVLSWDQKKEALAALREFVGTNWNIIESEPFLLTGRKNIPYLHKLADTVLAPYFTFLTDRLEVKKDWKTLYVFVARGPKEFSNIVNALYTVPPEDRIGVDLALALSDSPGMFTMAVCGPDATNCTAFAHELFHLVNAEVFEDAPWWLYEGMAELFESGDIRDGEFHPRPGWRKDGGEMEKLDAESFGALLTLSKNDPSLYTPPGAAVAMARARFFCYYLHEKNLLFPIYHTLKKRDWMEAAADPAGIRVIAEKLSGKSMGEVTKDFKAWFMEEVAPLSSPDKP